MSLWSGKFPDEKSLEDFRKSRGITDLVWKREYLLIEVPAGDPVIRKDDIHYYDSNKQYSNYRFTVISVDPASKTALQNDPTAMVTADVYGYGDNLKIRIRRDPINARLPHEEIVNKIVAWRGV